METITEEYVSFETAKLLKEKGFDGKCNKCYAYFADDDIRVFDLKYPKLAQSLIENRYPCITLQLAMRWLRVVHNIFIEISVDAMLKDKGYQWALYNNDTKEIKPYSGWGDSYEEAVEAAITYYLEHFIKTTMAKFKFESNDRIEEAVTNAASVLCNEYFKQNGMEEVADEHTDEWFEMQEELRRNILSEAYGQLELFWLCNG